MRKNLSEIAGCIVALLLTLPLAANAEDSYCPLRKTDLAKGGAHIIAPGGYSFKIEPSKKVAKVQQKAHLGEHPWTWIPLGESGTLTSYVRFPENKVISGVLSVEPGDDKNTSWSLITKVNPFKQKDNRWIVASQKGGVFRCEVVWEDNPTNQILEKKIGNNAAIEVDSPNLLYSKLGFFS